MFHLKIMQNYYTNITPIKPSFKRTINWNEYQAKITIQVANPYLDYLTDPSFQGVYMDCLFYHLKILEIEQYTTNIFFYL